MKVGSGLLAIWADVPVRRVWWNSSHSREKLVERVALPGVLHGRRYVRVDDPGRFFIRYDASDASVFAATSYRHAVQHPSSRTADASGVVRGFVRGVGHVVAASGIGAAGYCGVVVYQGRWSSYVTSSFSSALADRLCIDSDENLLIGYSISVVDPAVTALPSRERDLRGGSDGTFDVVVMVEALDAQSALSGLAVVRSIAQEQHVDDGAVELPVSGVYALIHSISESELSHGD